ncbi:hypothetical protein ACXWTF_13095 [Thiomicrolovo sp. ZZH C-3]
MTLRMSIPEAEHLSYEVGCRVGKMQIVRIDEKDRFTLKCDCGKHSRYQRSTLIQKFPRACRQCMKALKDGQNVKKKSGIEVRGYSKKEEDLIAGYLAQQNKGKKQPPLAEAAARL